MGAHVHVASEGDTPLSSLRSRVLFLARAWAARVVPLAGLRRGPDPPSLEARGPLARAERHRGPPQMWARVGVVVCAVVGGRRRRRAGEGKAVAARKGSAVARARARTRSDARVVVCEVVHPAYV